ncbi:basic helix-loop-helix dimerization domain bHLH [Methanococcus vannielii SB]|uniref:Basic helix-loop-helix dimerization domain bHLH n=1 Tax=Methanococcus vannielii (strain ATCC 35089 / DSM 1224 / JCM 13029 / OCM 148 / SB) TaxID=406327 RepID=A6UPZ1_METVS|nr:methanogenesis marker protein Mmp4/MtxX [Methanococcus vannielii]ABR54563.1 basic helix-loop-helix dimerization domain bHLH [Methanococcus vannielii SB]
MYAIGVGKNKKEVLIAVENLKKEGILVETVEDSEELIQGLLSRKYEGVIRGTLSSSEVIPKLKEKIGRFYRASILKNPFTGQVFLLTPVGIDEIKDDFSDKLDIIKYSSEFIQAIGLIPKIGLLSAGRLSDVGRSLKIDESIENCEEILKKVKNSNELMNVQIEHRGILIEEYLKDGFNIIVADDGISGNLLFRVFALVFEIEGFGAIILNSEKVKFIDTSRSGDSKRYYNAVKFLKNGF